MYTTTISTKGQIVLPKKLRDALGMEPHASVQVALDKTHEHIVIKLGKSIQDLAGSIRPKKVVPATKIRELMEKKYVRS